MSTFGPLAAVCVLAGAVLVRGRPCLPPGGAARWSGRVWVWPRARTRARFEVGPRRSRPYGAAPQLRLAGGRIAQRVGGRVRALARRPPAPAADRRVGAAVLVGVPLAMLHPLLGSVAALTVWGVPTARAAEAGRRQRDAVVDTLPDVVELLALSVGAGLNVRLALDAVSRAGEGPVVAVARRVLARIDAGERLADALDAFADLGDDARPLREALAASERYGVPIATALERVALELRLQRRRQAEAEARRTPVRVLFPLVLCFLPAFGLLTVVPLVAGSFAALAP